MSTPKKWRLKFTAQHLLGNLATDLYQDPADCLQEIVRNGMCACMPNGKWAPSRGNVEISLVDHPLGPRSKTLVILDHGSGFTDPAIELYCTVGRAVGDKDVRHAGAADKRIGRFAAFALNGRCMDDQDITTGFYILTRTSPDGPVTMVSMIPEKIELNDGELVVKTISPTATELGPQKGIKGSFTAIVVPHSVFGTYEEIRKALLWRLPRKKDKMYHRLMVGDRQMMPPPLADKVVVLQDGGGRIEAYVDRVEDDASDGGIWFTDADTGIRVASARVLGHQRLPHPLWRPDLTGDIFVPGLLANQDTSRSGLSSRYLASAAWQRAAAFLYANVVPQIKPLMGDDDVFGRDASSRALLNLVQQCESVWGKAEGSKGGGILFEDLAKPKRVASGGGSSGHGKGGHGSHANPHSPGNGKPRALPVRIGDRTFVLDRRRMDPHVFAEVDIGIKDDVIHINDGKYEGMPTTMAARNEHILLMILQAAAEVAHPDDVPAMRRFVGLRRKEFLRAK
jgi:hypothetical protein